MANKVWRIWFLWEYSISHGHWGNLQTIQSCLGAQSVSPRFDLKSKSKPDKTRKIKVVGGGERGQIVPECCKVGQVKMVLFLSTIVGRYNNTDNQIFAVIGSRIILLNIYNIRSTSLLSSAQGFTEDQWEQSMVVSHHSVRESEIFLSLVLDLVELEVVVMFSKQITVSSLFVHKVHQQPGRSSLCSDKEPQPEMYYSHYW